jgi:hypothetical protein
LEFITELAGHVCCALTTARRVPTAANVFTAVVRRVFAPTRPPHKDIPIWYHLRFQGCLEVANMIGDTVDESFGIAVGAPPKRLTKSG